MAFKAFRVDTDPKNWAENARMEHDAALLLAKAGMHIKACGHCQAMCESAAKRLAAIKGVISDEYSTHYIARVLDMCGVPVQDEDERRWLNRLSQLHEDCEYPDSNVKAELLGNPESALNVYVESMKTYNKLMQLGDEMEKGAADGSDADYE